MEPTMDPEHWSINEVKGFLKNNDFKHYIALFCDDNKIDGKVLLSLTEEDLQNPPLHLKTLGDQKRMWFLLEGLREDNRRTEQSVFKESYLNFKLEVDHDQTSTRSGFSNTSSLSPFSDFDEEFSDSKHLKFEPKTFGLSVLYIFVAHFTAGFSVTYAQEHLPDPKIYPPLPDILLDSLPNISWAYKVTEGVIILFAIMGFILLFLHKYRFVVAQRLMLIAGTAYLLRSLCVMSTAIPMPQYNYDCRALKFKDGWERLSYTIKIYAAVGLKTNGIKTCGDYVFSGHTVIITLLILSINEYIPRHWTFLRTFNWVAGIFGIFFILLGRGHYTLDVLLAFVISSKMFSFYHIFAHNANQITRDKYRTKQCFPVLYFFEKDSRGRIPNEYEWPLPRLGKLLSSCFGATRKSFDNLSFDF